MQLKFLFSLFIVFLFIGSVIALDLVSYEEDKILSSCLDSKLSFVDCSSKDKLLELSKDDYYTVKIDGFYNDDLKISDKGTVFIDKFVFDSKGYRVYHVDSLNYNNVSVKLSFYYEKQPDTIYHYNHNGQLVEILTPKDWVFDYLCLNDPCYDVGGYLTFVSNNIDYGLGSNTYPVGVTGPQWVTDDSLRVLSSSEYNYSIVGNNISVSFNSLAYMNSFANLTYSYYYISDLDYYGANKFQFLIEFDNFTAIIIFILFLICVILVYVKQLLGAGVLLSLIGFVLLISGFTPLLSLVFIIGGILLIFRA